jgi:hypothetical protein
VPSKLFAFVAFARVGLADGSITPPDFEAALEDALRPGKSVVRYNRLWRLPQHESHDGWITGRVGFEIPGNEAGVWDEISKDYRDISAAQLTRYMIDVRDRRVAFELKSSTIKPWTFQGNFQALLNADDSYQWRVTLEGIDQPPWEDWQESVSRITNMRIKLVPPNPRYRGKEVEELIEGAKLSAATLAVQGDDIEISDSELLKESIQHFQAGYGSLTAKAIVDGDGDGKKKVEWRSEEEGNVARERAIRDPETSEVPPSELKHLLQRLSDEQPRQ